MKKLIITILSIICLSNIAAVQECNAQSNTQESLTVETRLARKIKFELDKGLYYIKVANDDNNKSFRIKLGDLEHATATINDIVKKWNTFKRGDKYVIDNFELRFYPTFIREPIDAFYLSNGEYGDFLILEGFKTLQLEVEKTAPKPSVKNSPVKPSAEKPKAPASNAVKEIEKKESPVVSTPAKEPEEDSNEIYTVVEDEPEFPGGTKALMEFIAQNLRYPAFAAENGIQGRVTVTLVVEKDGSITDVQEMRSPSEDLTKEAKRVVLSMPKWKPGKQNGKPVRVKYMLPITFRLQGEGADK